MKLIFELSKTGRAAADIPQSDIPETDIASFIDTKYLRDNLDLPEVSESDLVRHYTNLSRRNFGVDLGFYPLGSCTMKYNPKINESVAAFPNLPRFILTRRKHLHRATCSFCTPCRESCAIFSAWLNLPYSRRQARMGN